MDSSRDEVEREFPGFFRVYKSGRVERFLVSEPVPPSTDPATGVQSKDVLITPETGVSARIFLPRLTDLHRKLPLLVYVHGGAFCLGSPFSAIYHRLVSSLAAESNAITFSIHYRLAPEHLLPAAYEDARAALEWAMMHSKGDGPESWLNDHADFERVFLAGDSAGANIVYNMAWRAGSDNHESVVKIIGIILVHPFFMKDEPDKLIEYLFPSGNGQDDPRLNPKMNPNLGSLGCDRALIFVAEKDWLNDRGRAFYEALKKSRWNGTVEMIETENEGHVFHLFNPAGEKTQSLLRQVASFVNKA